MIPSRVLLMAAREPLASRCCSALREREVAISIARTGDELAARLVRWRWDDAERPKAIVFDVTHAERGLVLDLLDALPARCPVVGVDDALDGLERLLDGLVVDDAPALRFAAAHRLSPVQARVLERLAAGRCAQEIALDMGLSLSTVHTHLERISARTGARGPLALLAAVLRFAGGGAPSAVGERAPIAARSSRSAPRPSDRAWRQSPKVDVLLFASS